MSGGVTLVRQYYSDGFYPSGKKTAGDAFNPTAALVKATAINSGKEMTGSGASTNPYKQMPYPNVDQGWGRIVLDDALYFDGDARKLWAVEERTGLQTGGAKDYQVGVEAATEHLEITLVWTDFPGTAGPTRNLVNDLDLEVTSPSGKAYKGNVFVTSGTPHQSQEGGTRDDLNNVESVLRHQPETGVWQVKVVGSAVAQGPQKFALVITGRLAPPTGVNLLSPKGGETLKGNSTATVQWTSSGAMQANSVDLSYSADGGASWKTIVTGQALNGSHQWPVPAIDSRTARVKLDAKDAAGGAKMAMSQDFSIDSTPPSSQVTAPGPVSLQPLVNLSLTSSDLVSGVKEIDVQYRLGTGSWQSAGRTNGSAFPFTATIEGRHEFQSLASDNAGWTEPAPATPDATVLVDLKPPTVLATTPPDGATDVKVDVDVVVRFSEPMDRPRVQAATAFESNKARITAFEWAASGDEAMTVKVEGYDSGQTYTLVVSAGAQDLAGRSLGGAPFQLTFTMQVETVPPEVIRTEPANGAGEVRLNSSVEIEFSEAMKTAPTQSAVTLSPKQSGNWSWSGNILTFTPANPGFRKGTTYKFTVGTGAQDRAGNALQQPYEFSFTTSGGGIPGLPPLFTGGLLGFGLVGDLGLLIILLVVVASAFVALRRRRRPAADPRFYAAGYGPPQDPYSPTFLPVGQAPPQGYPPPPAPGTPPVQPP
jgi:hypothetical protein